MRLLATLAIAGLFCFTIGAGDWPLFGHDAARTGVADDATITPANVERLRERWHVRLGGVVDGSPVAFGAMLFATTTDGTTYGIDARSGRIRWRFTTSGPKITTSTPAYDRTRHVLYAAGIDGAVHKLDPRTGREERGGGFPLRVTRAVATEKLASALNLANGYLYATTSGYIGDATPYVGHVVAMRLSDGAVHVFNALCGNEHRLIDPGSCGRQRAGIWARAGAVVDPDPAMRGRVYVATGNGPFDANRGGDDYGDSLIALSNDVTHLLGYYTPENHAYLDDADEDLASASPALLPRQAGSATPLLALQGGKNGMLDLVDRAHLGGVGKTVQRIDVTSDLFSAPAVWQNRGTTWIYVGLPGTLRAFRLVTMHAQSRLVPAWQAATHALKIPAEGSSPIVEGGIVFVASTGELLALDATNGRRLWSSRALGVIHWQSPIIAHGTLYCADDSGNLIAYGIR